VFNSSLNKIDKKYLDTKCLKFQIEFNQTINFLHNMGECDTSSGIKFNFITTSSVDYTSKCSGINQKDCQNLCSGIKGVLQVDSNKPFDCVTMKVNLFTHIFDAININFIIRLQK
jgi:hypothetical protein